MDALEANKKVKEPPPVPIKTYQWEDIRRSRRKGGYPWTYLNKRPFDDTNLDDFKAYKISRLRKTKSSINMTDNGVTIEEINSDKSNMMDTDENKENVIVKSNSLVDVSISQHLTKEDKPSPEDIMDLPGPSKTMEEIKVETLQTKRAKSEEPGRKRKHSIESSYSRISKYSLSRAGIMKKLKEAKDKIRLPKFFFTKSDSKIDEKSKTEVSASKISSKKDKVKSKKVEGPLIIHIPLKPPPGETDEFSYLEFADQKGTKGRDVSPIAEETKEEVPETPTVSESGVQLIILTAPSDDEILDVPSVPETPSEANLETKGFDELKDLAKDAVNKYSPETPRKLIPIVQEEVEELPKTKMVEIKMKEVEKELEIVEESVVDKPPIDIEKGAKKKKKVVKKLKKDKEIDKGKEEKLIEHQKTDDDKIQEKIQREASDSDDKDKGELTLSLTKTKIMVDEEDGLKTEAVIAKIIEEDVKDIEKQVKETKQETGEDSEEVDVVEESPVLKKKVSFKRRSKEDSEGIYEDVQVRTDPVIVGGRDEDPEHRPAASPTPNLLIDEKMTKVHAARVRGMTIAEEYEYWCRVNCNDYEPINPPDDEFRSIAQGAEVPKKPLTPVTDSDIEFLAAKAADIELRTTGIITIGNKEEPSEALFVPLESALKADSQSNKSDKEPKEESHGKRFQEAIQKQASNLKRQASIISKKAGDQAEKIQTRVKSIKKPNIKMPPKPKFEKPAMPKFKIEKPSLPKLKIERPKMPSVKIPEKMKNISLSLPRKGKRTPHRPTSTESTAGDSEKRTIFDFSTYPRIFKKKKRQDDGVEIHTPRTGTDITPVSERTTLPRFKFTTRWKGKFTEQPTSSGTIDTENSLRSKDSEHSEAQGSIRITLHSEGSIDRESLDLRTKEERESDYREDSVERRMRMASSRYDDDIDTNDAYMKENQEIHRASSLNAKFNDRWNHGTFHDDLEDQPEQINTDLEKNKSRSILKKKIENIHPGSSDDIHRRGVLEEINSDEFFLRQKGISQDNIEVGAYLSSEIREAFRTPNNALSQIERTMPEAPRRHPLKKPKRKKTPHVSQEAIEYYQDSVHSEPDEYPKYLDDDFQTNIQPERPKRRSRKKDLEDLKYMEDQILMHDEYLDHNKRYLYENEHMQGIEQPGIMVSDSYHAEHFYPDDEDVPEAPPRREKSLRSLNAMSEHDSITGELNGYKEIQEIQQDMNQQFEHEYQIPTPDQPPKRPCRTRSRTRSRSRGTTLPDEDTLAKGFLSPSQESLTCNEEPFHKVVCDYMGYPVADKSLICEPPLPPCRRRSLKSEPDQEVEHFFSTLPSKTHEQPMRPLRNYSTLGPSRPPRKRSVPNLTDEEKNTVSQYDEIEDEEHAKNLQSGEVIQKMKDRPLPAPPRPPRKSRDLSRGSRKSERSLEELQELEASVQTEPLPDGFECEELVRDSEDRVITPTVDKYASVSKPRNIKDFEHQETITHGALVLQTFGHGDQIPEGPLEMFSRSTERIITVKREAESDVPLDYDETSEIPEDFQKLQTPTIGAGPQVIERIIERHIPIMLEIPSEVEILKAQKLQVGDLDVDRLAVNELHANKIKVGEIESSAINVNEINSNSGNLVVSGIELPASFFQQLVAKLQEQAEQVAVATRPIPPLLEEPKSQQRIIETRESQTNTDTYIEPHSSAVSQGDNISMHDNIPHTSTFNKYEHEPSQRPQIPIIQTENTLREEVSHTIDAVILAAREAVEDELDREAQIGKKKTPFEVGQIEELETPQRPPRSVKCAESVEMPPSAFSEGDEIPPPRPPQPDSDYVPSQPPASFYAIRSPTAFKDFDIDDDIPLAPRRRRHHHHQHQHKALESSSDEVAPIRRRHHTPEPTIPQLTGQLTRACFTVAERSLRRLIQQVTDYVMGHVDGKHEVNVALVILIVFIALLFLIGWNGDSKQIHHHHWEYFNPPRDI